MKRCQLYRAHEPTTQRLQEGLPWPMVNGSGSQGEKRGLETPQPLPPQHINRVGLTSVQKQIHLPVGVSPPDMWTGSYLGMCSWHAELSLTLLFSAQPHLHAHMWRLRHDSAQ